MKRRILLVGLLGWIPVAFISAQHDSSGGRIENRGGGRVGVRTASRPPLGDAGSVVRPLYLTGKVVLPGGAPLPSLPRVELKCNGSVRKSVHTSPEGLFTFVLGTHSPKAGAMDASLGGPTVSTGGVNLPSQRNKDPYRRDGVGVSLGSGRVDLSFCFCQAVLTGYQSQPIALGIRSVFDSSEIGQLKLYPLGEVAGSTISLNSLNAPRKAKDSFKKAEKELGKEKVNHSKVEKHLRKSIEIYPQYAEAWQLLGEVELLQGKEPEARDNFRQAITADPQFITPYLTLGELEVRAHAWESAAQLMGKAIELNPHLIQAHYFFALSKYYLRQDDEAEISILKVIQSEEAHLFPGTHYLLGGIHEDRGDFQEAAIEFQRFLKTAPPEELVQEVEAKIEAWKNQGLIPLETNDIGGN